MKVSINGVVHLKAWFIMEIHIQKKMTGGRPKGHLHMIICFGPGTFFENLGKFQKKMSSSDQAREKFIMSEPHNVPCIPAMEQTNLAEMYFEMYFEMLYVLFDLNTYTCIESGDRVFRCTSQYLHYFSFIVNYQYHQIYKFVYLFYYLSISLVYYYDIQPNTPKYTHFILHTCSTHLAAPGMVQETSESQNPLLLARKFNGDDPCFVSGQVMEYDGMAGRSGEEFVWSWNILSSDIFL